MINSNLSDKPGLVQVASLAGLAPINRQYGVGWGTRLQLITCPILSRNACIHGGVHTRSTPWF